MRILAQAANAATKVATQLNDTPTDDQGGTFWMMPQRSTVAGEVDWVFNFILWISIIFFVLIVALMILFILRYHRHEGRMNAEPASAHNTALELTWTIIPLILVVIIFYLGFTQYVTMATPPEDALKINVEGQKWSWAFTYPNGHVDSTLHVPVDSDVVLTMTSIDVIHSLYIPAFRMKKDVVPGRYNKLWFHATEPGEYNVFCAEYCGTKHSDMVTRCVVHPPGEYEVWLENADPLKKLTDEQYEEYMADPMAFIEAHPEIEGLETPAIIGGKLYAKRGCTQCHSVDGTGGTGPTFKGVFGHEVVLSDGSTVVADENYIRKSILEPSTDVVKGFQNVMPTYQGRLKEREITALVAYIESLSDGTEGGH